MKYTNKKLFEECLTDVKNGFTVIEVIVALFIFGVVSLSLLKLITQTDRIRGRALYVENASRLASDEAERLRNTAAQNGLFEDSSFTQEMSGRLFSVDRQIITTDATPSYTPEGLKPIQVNLIISDVTKSTMQPLTFQLLIGSDHP